MIARSPYADPDLCALLEQGRAIPAVPAAVRARALDRARAISDVVELPRLTHAPRRRALLVGLAASLALAAITASAVAALRSLTSRPSNDWWHVPSRTVSPRIVPPVLPLVPATSQPVVPPPALPIAEPPYAPPAKHQRAAHAMTAQESYAAELELLQRAQTAYAAGGFSEALGLVGDHARRFPNGRLAEEREALRVKSLASSGHSEEASRAAAAFADRFPRSVLLPRLGGSRP